MTAIFNFPPVDGCRYAFVGREPETWIIIPWAEGDIYHKICSTLTSNGVVWGSGCLALACGQPKTNLMVKMNDCVGCWVLKQKAEE